MARPSLRLKVSVSMSPTWVGTISEIPPEFKVGNESHELSIWSRSALCICLLLNIAFPKLFPPFISLSSAICGYSFNVVGPPNW